MRPFRYLIRTLVLAIYVMIAAAPVMAKDVYSFGVVPQFTASQTYKIWGPILNELGDRTGLEFKLKSSSEIPAFEASVLNGEFDFAYMNPYHFLLAEDLQGYVPLVRDHGRELYGILVVPEYSDIQDVSELHGKEIAYPAPNALGASLLMRTVLEREHGVIAKPKYVSTHTSAYLAAAVHDTAAGGGVKATLDQQNQILQKSLRILFETPRVPPHPIAAHPRVPAEVHELVKQTFLDIADSEEGRSLLANVPFVQLGEAISSDYQVLVTFGLEDFYVSPN